MVPIGTFSLQVALPDLFVAEDREMFRHRLAPEADYYRLPEPPAPKVHAGSFSLWTVAVIPWCTLGQWVGAQQAYLLAFEHAVETARPALPDRGLFAFWN
jgi:hypothetical protein